MSSDDERETSRRPLAQGNVGGQSPGTNSDVAVCGDSGCGPRGLQRLATVNTYAVLYGLLGLLDIAINTYLVAVFSTLEKRFGLPTTTSGVVLASFEVSAMVCTPALTYLGSRGHRPRWVSVACALMGIACMCRLALHLALGPGQRALSLTIEHGAQVSANDTSGPAAQLCGSPPPPNPCTAEDIIAAPAGASLLSAPTLVLIGSQLLLGAGASIFFSLGLTYMDDNTPKHRAPLLIAVSQFVRMFGATFGYLIASYCLRQYVVPTLTPVITEKDPRWIGAWWIGWLPLTLLAYALSLLVLLFPRHLPTPWLRPRCPDQPQPPTERSLADFWRTTRRLLGNPLIMLNTFSSVVFMFGMSGTWAFMPKYLETHFQQSASTAVLALGSFGLVSTALGLLASGLVIWRFRPRPRSLAAWNVAVELTDALVRLGWTFIGCADDGMHGAWTTDGRWNLTSECNAACGCGPHVEFSPVCADSGGGGGGASFYSACHAGCREGQLVNGTMRFADCSCVPGAGVALGGPCAQDCASVFMAFLATQSVLFFLEASGRAGNALLHFRCVDQADKSQAIAFTEAVMCALVYMPAPVVYGMIFDSTCKMWSVTCGTRGNCWLHDTARMRHVPNLVASGLLLIGTVLDMGVWYYAKDVRLYDEDDGRRRSSRDVDSKHHTELSVLSAAMS